MIMGLLNSMNASVAATREIVFISGDLLDLDILLASVPPGARAVVLDPGQNSMRQIAQILNDAGGMDAIHIVSHGTPGMLYLGGAMLNCEKLADYASELETIRQSLNDGADLRLYGCNVAQGNEGQAFIAALADITGADVAASVGLIGAAHLGGNWQLEFRTGLIKTRTLHANINSVLVANTTPPSVSACCKSPPTSVAAPTAARA
jgi:hypothetical protein